MHIFNSGEYERPNSYIIYNEIIVVCRDHCTCLITENWLRLNKYKLVTLSWENINAQYRWRNAVQPSKFTLFYNAYMFHFKFCPSYVNDWSKDWFLLCI